MKEAILFKNFIYLFILEVLGLRCRSQALLSFCEWELSFF